MERGHSVDGKLSTGNLSFFDDDGNGSVCSSHYRDPKTPGKSTLMKPKSRLSREKSAMTREKEQMIRMQQTMIGRNETRIGAGELAPCRRITFMTKKEEKAAKERARKTKVLKKMQFLGESD